MMNTPLRETWGLQRIQVISPRSYNKEIADLIGQTWDQFYSGSKIWVKPVEFHLEKVASIALVTSTVVGGWIITQSTAWFWTVEVIKYLL